MSHETLNKKNNLINLEFSVIDWYRRAGVVKAN